MKFEGKNAKIEFGESQFPTEKRKGRPPKVKTVTASFIPEGIEFLPHVKLGQGEGNSTTLSKEHWIE